MPQHTYNAPLAAAIKDRARIYLAAFRAVRDRHGETEAIAVMRAASREHGLEVGRGMAHLAPCDFAGMADAWAKSPDDGATFNPDIRRLDEDGLEVHMRACPLKDAWFEAGCTDEEVVTLLQCASAYDEAALEAAGFSYEIELWKPGRAGCCASPGCGVVISE